MTKKCGICGYRINPFVMQEAGDLTHREWVDFVTNPVMSWCDFLREWVPDTRTDCPHWVSYEEHNAQMQRYGI
ncbi:MAG: hypothetical protein K9K66_01275 [Desulfarculaceae bacterium]|nr:hypothetical protein [Desulfarculaceae bacterium]MCF8072344.1 hypothetical protein [Desulfarculaceae bacterium]MCF8100265.1 hypothetical protein [Desulfarculaceae bacterium]MCF8116162.1 hypothetical protein [Desulfarculaceae bacterium]